MRQSREFHLEAKKWKEKDEGLDKVTKKFENRNRTIKRQLSGNKSRE